MNYPKKQIKISTKIIESVYNIFGEENIAVSASGGKDSTLTLFLVREVVLKKGYKPPLVIVGDPFPIPKVRDFIVELVKEYGFPYVLWENYVTDECLNVRFEKTGNIRQCCLKCKVEVLKRILREHNIKVLIVGIRWDEHPARARDSYFEKHKNPDHIRVKPILHWSFIDVLEFYRIFPDFLNPAYLDGYTSLGCAPCTKPAVEKKFKTAEEFIDYVEKQFLEGKLRERQGRIIDKELIISRLRKLGYF